MKKLKVGDTVKIISGKDKGKVGRDNSWGYGVIDVEKLIGGGDAEAFKTHVLDPFL